MFQKLIRTLIFCFIWVNGEIQTLLTSPKFNHRHKYPKWIEYWSNRLTVIVNWYRNMAHCLQFWGDRSNVEPSTTVTTIQAIPNITIPIYSSSPTIKYTGKSALINLHTNSSNKNHTNENYKHSGETAQSLYRDSIGWHLIVNSFSHVDMKFEKCRGCRYRT